MRRALWVVGILALLLIAGYFIAVARVRKKIETALHTLPPGYSITYTSLHLRLLNGAFSLDDVHVRGNGQDGSIHELKVEGIRYAALLHHRLQVRAIRLDGCSVDIGEGSAKMVKPEVALPFTAMSVEKVEIGGLRITGSKQRVSVEGEVKLDSLALDSGKWSVGGVYLLARRIKSVIPGSDEAVTMDGVMLDSKKGVLRMDTVRLRPTENKEEIGKRRGYQVDVMDALSEGIVVEGLDVMRLMRKQLVADRISVRKNDIYVFRDRRLPLKAGEKPLPVEGLESLPVTLRVGSVSLGSTFFEYEEYPKLGKETGKLKIYRLHGTLEPLINHPRAGDPAFLTMTMHGSLMNSGTVTATTKL
ncbi:MAG TPA: hypothetical protein VGQ51_08455, partial [Puia sp.]|nr:hypothetical protein [Puia sp.]